MHKNIDYCATCKVEPPQLKFKCPSCDDNFEMILDEYRHEREINKLKQTLRDLKEIVYYDTYTSHIEICAKLSKAKKKIEEIIDV